MKQPADRKSDITIDRSLYIITKQIKQKTDHKISIEYVNENPGEVHHEIIDAVQNNRVRSITTFTIHRVKLNMMGAKDVQIIDYPELVADARAYRELVSEENSKEISS